MQSSWLLQMEQLVQYAEEEEQGKSAPRSRSTRPPGGGVKGGVMVAMGGIGNILMLSSASAPSRVPHVV